ncbi:MAG: MFS transporter [Steroidobacteraceae bacterium]
MSNVSESTSNEAPMSAAQWVVIGLSVLFMALDGFDMLSISFASSGIAAEWGINFAGLGWVLSIELFGMAVGAVFGGGISDRLGRRPVLLGCLLLTAVGMGIAGHAPDLTVLITARAITGLGIGGILVCTNSMAAEFSNARLRTFCVALVGVGYPVGAAAGGFAVAAMLGHGGWRFIFNLGALCALVALPLGFWLIPESPRWLARSAQGGAGVGTTARPALRWPPALVWVCVLVTATYLLHVFSFYFMLKWIPRILTSVGYTAPQAARVLTWANVGGAIGGMTLGILAGRTRNFAVTLALLLISAAAVVAFGMNTADVGKLIPICILAGFGCNGAILGIYAIIASSFPVEQRGMGTGIAIGVGRLGAVLAPIVAGYLLQVGLSIPLVATVMACGSLLSVLALCVLKRLQPLQAAAAA